MRGQHLILKDVVRIQRTNKGEQLSQENQEKGAEDAQEDAAAVVAVVQDVVSRRRKTTDVRTNLWRSKARSRQYLQVLCSR
ncbi:hypothetical protein Rhal01_03068 [Rubritalea halochordaticola]|uniref:Uncharacterized protein n=1 Tax=Rubritalea halochordaticola TaxID=714537 RepID=A0ABP9V4G5_9BACT